MAVISVKEYFGSRGDILNFLEKSASGIFINNIISKVIMLGNLGKDYIINPREFNTQVNHYVCLL